MVQLYSVDASGKRIFVENSVKGTDYFCIECGHTVRLRGGNHRQLHFYHVQEMGSCSQRKKTIEHLLTQKTLEEMIIGVELEVRMETIGRIADVFWPIKNIVFEIQVSPMTREEALQRITDYKKVGIDVIFILHTKNFFDKRASELEEALTPFTHYFTDIDEEGGSFFDTCSWVIRRKRFFLPCPRLKKLPISLDSIDRRDSFTSQSRIQLINQRETSWLFQTEGDLLSQKIDATTEAYAEAFEQQYLPNNDQHRRSAATILKKISQLLIALYKKMIEAMTQ